MSDNNSFALEKLEVYQLSRELSKNAWKIYEQMKWNIKKILGDQFIESTDSVGANIAEGYGRYHYLDRIKFYYNSRGSLLESHHWLELLEERGIIVNKEVKSEYIAIFNKLKPKLNNLISAIYKNRKISKS